MLEKSARWKPTTPEMLALRDRANLSLGLVQLRRNLHESALETLSRIRLEGPMSQRCAARLRLGLVSHEPVRKGDGAWRVLLQRNAVDAATQEAILAIPANYAEGR